MAKKIAKDSASLEVSGPRKRKLSVKSATNSDPLEAAWKRKKSLSAVNNGATATLTQKKKAVPSKTATGTSKRATVEDADDSDDDSDGITLDPPHNPNHILEAADGSDNNSEPKIISVVDDDDKMDSEDGDETDLEAAGECAETELGWKFHFFHIY